MVKAVVIQPNASATKQLHIIGFPVTWHDQIVLKDKI